MAKQQVDLFAEKRLLQTLYYQTEFLDHIKVNEEIFSSSSTRNVYKAILDLKESKIRFSRDALLQAYSKIDIDASQNIIDVVTEKQNQKLESIDDIIKQLEDAKQRRSIKANLKQAIEEIDTLTHINEENTDKIKELIENAEASLKIHSDDVKRVMTFEEWASDYEKELNLRKKGKQYNFYNFILDELIPDGPRPGEIGIVASSSGSGKSTIIINAVNSLIDVQIPCMYISLEMSSIATMDRLLSKRLEIKYSDIVNPKEQGQYEDICSIIETETLKLTSNKRFRFSEDPSMSLSDLRKHIKKFQTDLGQKYCIIFIDLLSMITDFMKLKNGLNLAQGIEDKMNILSAIAKEFGVHIIGVLQLNRSQESEVKCNDVKDLQKFKPNRSQIKNGGGWNERARYVITSFRERMYAELYLEPLQYEDMLDIVECTVVKYNNGPIGKSIRGLFNGEYFSVEPIDDSV